MKNASRETTFETTGAALSLLFLLDPETVREVNNAVMLIQHNMNSVLANRLVMRMGNCITRATYNVNDYQVMTEVTATMGMVRCERMLRAFCARVAGEANAAELSQAGTSSCGAAAKGTRASRGRRAARAARGRGRARRTVIAATPTRWTGRRRRREATRRARVAESESKPRRLLVGTVPPRARSVGGRGGDSESEGTL